MYTIRFVVIIGEPASVSPLLEEISASLVEFMTEGGGFTAGTSMSYQRNGIDRVVVVFSVELDGDADLVASARTFVIESLQASDDVKHILRVYDDLIQEQNAKMAQRIYRLESRLREALSVLMLNACDDESYYSLLSPSQVSTAKDFPKQGDLEAAHENEFFYIQFSDYRNVINRKPPTNMAEMLTLIQSSLNYDDLRLELRPHLISEPTSTVFVANLAAVLDPIEKVRNAIAHNRSITSRMRSNFERSADQLERIIGDFFSEQGTDDSSFDQSLSTVPSV